MAAPQSDDLQVIGAGLMRTGTFSLHVALEKLFGGKCYHMTSVHENPHHVNFWIQACKEDPSDEEWREFFKDYTAAVDFPAVVFYERLIRVYPNAKVVLTVRDPEKWFQSVNNTIAKVLGQSSSFPSNLLTAFTSKRNFVKMVNMLFDKSWRCDASRLSDHDFMIRAYNEHVERVKDAVPPEKLLIFQAAEGWQPLCEFLGVPVPDEPYPRLNTTEDFQKTRFLRPTKALLVGSVIVAAVGVGIWSFSRYFAKR